MKFLLRRKRKDTEASSTAVEEHVPGQEAEDEVCQTCFNWTLRVPPPKDDGPDPVLNLEFSDIVASKATGRCRYCHVINQCLVQFEAKFKPGGNTTVSITGAPNKSFFVSWDDEKNGYTSLQVYRLIACAECAIEELGYARGMEGDVGSPEMRRKIRKWLQYCEENHPKCNQVQGTLPRRLIYIGLESEGWKLIQGVDPDTRYATLSHCWGEESSFTTSKATLQDRIKGITQNELPATFQNAVTVAQALGLEYLWIDSLCIVQDDDSDWKHETSRMGGIYERACVTIAASSSSGDHLAFLESSRGRSYYAGHDIDAWPFMSTSYIVGRPVHDVRQATSMDPLARRAWAFQERLMSKRYLSYSTALTWTCRGGFICECGLDFKADPLFNGPSYSGLELSCFEQPDKPAFVRLMDQDPPPSFDLHYLWYNEIVHPYSRRELTRHSDRLPAFSGVVKRFHEKIPHDNYLAGLWEQDITRGLLWTTKTSESGVPGGRLPEDGYRAPSWSWASVEGPMSFLSPHQKAPNPGIFRTSVIEAQCQPESMDSPYGHVSDGFLRLKGPATLATLTISPTVSLHSKEFKSSPIKENVWLDTPVQKLRLPGDCGTAIVRSHHPKQQQKVKAQVTCVVLHDSVEVVNNLSVISRRVLLVLAPSARREDAFEPLGIVRLDLPTDKTRGWYEEFKEKEYLVI
ncbi:hypothetical protein CEP54_007520 [Fusarium duplospermum]|uniref:Heterokaryon incompatibility domain-containing protein n=1 Tax=Fusarium duplospermum TaxID=1325734 RepID=A0A428Q168_9HYPO|nr:hypothetical protein CEP54_007520 [Fusarium duplospermum]